MQWESGEFVKVLRELRSYKEKLGPHKHIDFYDDVRLLDGGRGISFYLPLSFVLLPTYMHKKIPESCKDIIKPKKSEVVDINELSLFDVYKVVDSLEGRFRLVKFGISIEYRKDIDSYGLDALRVIAKDEEVVITPQDLLIVSAFHDDFREENTRAKYLEKIEKLQGKKYSEIEGIDDDISWIEESLITILNLINVLHTNEFDENDIVGWLLKPYSDTFKGFGCEFEEALLTASKVISAFLF
jgi:hypothetical protein